MPQQLTPGEPEIRIKVELRKQLGGQAIEGLVKAPVANALHNSDRFQVLLDHPSRFMVRATLSNLRISQQTESSRSGLGGLMSEWVGKSVRMGDKPITADWARDEQRLLVECGVSCKSWTPIVAICFCSPRMGRCLGRTRRVRFGPSWPGFIFSADNLKTGSRRRGAALPEIKVDYQSKNIELAVWDALRLLVPKLNAALPSLPTDESPARPIGVMAGSKPAEDGAEQTTSKLEDYSPVVGVDAGKPAFRTRCGTRKGTTDRFCAGCGQRLGT